MFLQVALPAAGGAVPARAARPVRCRRQPGAASGPAGAASWLYTRASGRVGAKRARKVGSADRGPGAQHGPKEVGWDCAQIPAPWRHAAPRADACPSAAVAHRPAWVAQHTTSALPHAINPLCGPSCIAGWLSQRWSSTCGSCAGGRRHPWMWGPLQVGQCSGDAQGLQVLLLLLECIGQHVPRCSADVPTTAALHACSCASPEI